MNGITIDHDKTDEDILTYEVSDEVLETAGTEMQFGSATLYNTLQFCCAC